MHPRITSRHGSFRSQRGQATVELAFVLAILIALVLGALYLARYLNYSNEATQLAGEGARFAAVTNFPSCTDSGGTYTTWTAILRCRAGKQSTGFRKAV